MKHSTLKLSSLLCLSGGILFLQYQCSTAPIAGNSSQAGNGMVVGMLYEPDGLTRAKGNTAHLMSAIL